MEGKKHNKSIVGKIIITCLLACTAIFMSLYISKFTFNKILSTVDRLSTPNAGIQLVNSLFKEVVRLDQLQRRQALGINPEDYNPFLKESESLQTMLDSLRSISIKNPTQVARIDSMKQILYQRDFLFLKYTKLHADLVRNDTLAGQVKNLSRLIETTRQKMDSNIITTSRETKTVVDTIQEEEEKQSLWNRIFSKRKPRITQVQKQVAEELKVRVDTIKLGNSGDSLAKIGSAITKVEMNRLSRRSQLLKKEVELNNTGNLLVNQLMSILNDIEQDELQAIAQQNIGANDTVNKGLVWIGIVFGIFILATIVLVVLIFTDIARSNQYRRELIIAKEEAEEAGRVKQRFLANMSHELRTPLQTIIGTSEQVRTMAAPRRQDLENIHQSSLHLLQIVNEVLDYSRIISGKYVIESHPFNLSAVLDEVKEMIGVQVAAKKLEMKYEAAIGKDEYYLGDAFRLKQVLLNVLGNAVKFTTEGIITLSVNEKAFRDNTSLFTFIIADTGPGIAPENIAVIFNEFEQGNNAGRKQGTGLGLSIVKAMIDIQNGSIKAESELGKGSVFTITLPFTRTGRIEQAQTVVQDITGYKGHVWVVDDDAFILQLCDTILTKHAIPHTCFNSSLQADATPFPPDLGIVFLDVRMAEMDGIELCRRLKERPVEHAPKIIALTAQAFPEEQEEVFRKGFDALVIKPFLEQDFIGAIFAATPQVRVNERSEGFDLSVIGKMTGDNKELLAIVLQSFITEMERDMAEAKQNVKDNDSYQLAETLHKLAGRCGQTGATSLAHQLRHAEITLHNGGTVQDILPEMDNIYSNIKATIAAVNKMI